MKKTLLTLLVFLPNICYANELYKFSEQISYFYLNPTKNSFLEFQTKAVRFEKELKASNKSIDIMIALMIARISEKHNWSIKESIYSSQAKEILKGKSDLAVFINDDNSVNPTKLDLWWVSYFSTGEEKYLKKLLKYAGEEMPKGDIKKISIIGAATWSFKANCKQHESVKNFALKISKDKSIEKNKIQFLMECIKYAEEESS